MTDQARLALPLEETRAPSGDLLAAVLLYEEARRGAHQIRAEIEAMTARIAVAERTEQIATEALAIAIGDGQPVRLGNRIYRGVPGYRLTVEDLGEPPPAIARFTRCFAGETP